MPISRPSSTTCRALARHGTVRVHPGKLPQRAPGHAGDPAADDTAASRQPTDAPRWRAREARGRCGCSSTPSAGGPRNKFEAGSPWVRAPDSSAFPPVAANATSGHTSWHAIEPDTTVSPDDSSGRASGRAPGVPVVPAVAADGGSDPAQRQPPELRRRHGRGGRHDARPGAAPGRGTVLGQRAADRIFRHGGNPAGGRFAFSRDSRGYLASRLKLTRYAGHAVAPQFTMNIDNVNPDEGWFLDDIRIYTCSRGPSRRARPPSPAPRRSGPRSPPTRDAGPRAAPRPRSAGTPGVCGSPARPARRTRSRRVTSAGGSR